MKQLANKIKEIRKLNHLTQEELARSLGYANKTMINHIEAGERGMSYEKLILLVKKYQLSLEDFVGKENNLCKQENEYLANLPDKDSAFPNPNLPYLCYIKNTIKNKKHIIVGDYTYYYDEKDRRPFEDHVTHLYEFSHDKLIIGKFCSIGHGVEFIMNAANHKMNSISTYPFYIMGGKWGSALAPKANELPNKGDTVIGNDVWIGQNVTFLPGVKVGDGVIIGANSVVSKDIPPYVVAAGNPVRIIRKRFDDDMIKLLEKLKWWDKPINEIDALIPILSDSNLKRVKAEIKKLVKK